MNIAPYLLCLLGLIGLPFCDSQSPEQFVTESIFNDTIAQLLGKINESETKMLQAQHAATVQLNNQLKETLTLLSDLSHLQLTAATSKQFFFEAVVNGDERSVRSWIRLGFDVNAKDPQDNGRTALLKAARSGYTSIVKDLLNAGAKPNEKDYDGETALYRAAQYGHNEIVAALFEAGADPKEKNNDGKTPLHMAAAKGHKDVVDRLVLAGADLNVTSKDGSTPLQEAVFNGKTEVAKALLQAGGRNLTQDKGDLALQGNQTEDRMPSSISELKNLRAAQRRWRLIEAAEKGDENFIRWWIRIGYRVDERDPTRETTALHAAARAGHTSVVKELLNAGAKPNEKDRYGQTPLHGTAENGHKEIIDLLIEAGANPNAKDTDGKTPLHCAAQYGLKEAADRLIVAGADPNEKDEYGMTPLHKASQEGYNEIALRLIKAGADLNQKQNDGRTPLHLAAYRRDTDVVKTLLRGGASTTVTDDDGRTPRDYALEWNQLEIAKILSAVNA